MSDLVRERTLADRETEKRLYGRETRSGLVGPATPLHPPVGLGGRHAQHGAAEQAAAANVRVPPAEPDFTASPPASVNGPRVPAPRGARAQLQHDTTDSMNSGPVGGSADAVGHLDGRQASA